MFFFRFALDIQIIAWARLVNLWDLFWLSIANAWEGIPKNQRARALSEGKGADAELGFPCAPLRAPAPAPSLFSRRPSAKSLRYFMQLLKQWNGFCFPSRLSVSTWDLLEISLKLLLLISCNNVVINITHSLTFAQREGVKFFLLSMIILPLAFGFWSYWNFFVVLIHFLGAIHMHDKRT